MPRKSTIICPQRDPKGWSEMLCGDKVTCDAIAKKGIERLYFAGSKKG